MYFGSCCLILLMALPFGLLVFAFAAPSFHCKTANITCAHRTCCNNCTSYSFERAFTNTVTEWNLVCDRASLNAAIQTSMFVGMLIGATISGMVSDSLGRKACIFIFNDITTVSGFASSFSNSVSLMAFLWFVMGFGLTGLILSHYIYIMEIVGPKYRTMAGNVNMLYWCAGSLLMVLIAYYIRDWRTLTMISTAPGVLLYLFWRIFTESPRWLVAHDHLEEASLVLLKYGGKQKKPIDEESLKNIIGEVRRVQAENQQETKVNDPRLLCGTPKLRKWSASLGFNWFGCRIPHAVVMFLVGILCLLVLVIPDKYPMVKSGLFLAAAGITFSVWTTVYIITSEIYPTVVRNTAQGTGSTIGRIGGTSAPFVAMLGRIPGIGNTVPLVLFGTVPLLAGAISLLIPETLFAPMHQTIEEAEAATDDYGIPCCGKPGKKLSMRSSDAELHHLSDV